MREREIINQKGNPMRQKEFIKTTIQFGIKNNLSGTELMNFVIDQVKKGLMNGECHYSKGILDEKDALRYSKALYKNTMMKDLDMNGGTPYTPSTKRGPIIKDEKLKDLKKVLKSLQESNGDPALISKVESLYETRMKELESEKKKETTLTEEETLSILQKYKVI